MRRGGRPRTEGPRPRWPTVRAGCLPLIQVPVVVPLKGGHSRQRGIRGITGHVLKDCNVAEALVPSGYYTRASKQLMRAVCLLSLPLE